jgi:hypothetical protein
MPALWKRSRRGLFRAAAVIGALAAVAGGLATVTAVPARADQPITSDGPYAVTYSSGDLVASEDVADVAPAALNNFLSTSWPEAVGLSAGASLSSLFQATWQQYSVTWQQNPTAQGFPEPPAFSGGSASAVSDGDGGSTVTIDIPAADVQANASVPGWAQGILAQMAGAAAAAAVWAICEPAVIAFGTAAMLTTGPTGAVVLGALGSAICGGFGSAAWTFIASVVSHAFTNTPFTPEVWLNIATASMTAFVGGALVGFMAPAIRWVFKKVMAGIGTGLGNIVGFIKPYLPTSWQNFIDAVQRFFSRGVQQEEEGLPLWELPGIPASDGQFMEEGYFQAYPFGGGAAAASGTSGNCMDAYGSDGNPPAGQSVAINACDGGPSQLWDIYSNGMVTAGGLCLDTKGGTSSIGTPLVDLQPCDGSADQQWTQSGSAVVNKATSYCLDDPNADTTPGTHLDIFPCNSSPAQGWLGPAGEPCDIYAANGTGCVAAYSMTRAMYAAYNGPLYQVKRASDDMTDNIGLLTPGGDANAGTQNSFCANTTCIITEIYDQSPLGNNLTIEGVGGNGPADGGAIANALPIKINGNNAYGLDVEPGVGYRDDTTIGVATKGQPEGMYMVASGTHVNSGCCFDFGNAEADNDDNKAGHMDAVNLSTTCFNGGTCSGSGPWVQADMEDGLFMGSTYTNTANKGNNTPFVTAMLGNNGQDSFSLNGGDSTSGGLSTWYNGALPAGYAPMSQEGGIVLGTGGDNSQSDVGSWFEGVMTAGDPSQAADAAVQANIVAAGYSGTTNPVATSAAGASAAGQAVVHTAGATGAGASGFSSVYTVDSANGHLQETYLPYMGDGWTTQDLSGTGGTLPGTPPVMPGTQPVALVHCGYTSVFTVDGSSGDLQETYLPAIGDAWATQDLSAKYQTPPTDTTPTAVVHTAGASGASTGCGYTSVYTVNRDGDLQETYLPNQGFPGDAWITQDLSATGGTLPGTPQVLPGTAPVAIVHCGFTSVYSVDASNHHLQETYLPAIGDSWSTQDLSGTGGTLPGTPPTNTTPTAVMHTAGAPGASQTCGYTSVYTVDQGSQDLQETYLPNTGFPGDSWATQDLTAKYQAPPVAPGTAPTALVHLGFTSLYTVDQGSDHLQETYLPAIGDGWSTQDLSGTGGTLPGTPVTDQTPIVLLHPDASGLLDWTSVFTVNEFNAHLQETYLSNVGFPGDGWSTQDLSAKYLTPPVYVQQSSPASWSVAHSGYTSTYTVDAANGHLWETYLPAMGDGWSTQDLSAELSSPAVAPDSTPVALVHDGYTSVYTVDQGSGDLRESYLPAIGDSWASQNLSGTGGTLPGTPPVSPGTSPTTVFHDGYVSVYTVDQGSGDLQETYLPAAGFPGDSWHTQNLSGTGGTLPGTPPVMPGTSPVAILHDGYVSVYTVDTNGDLQETFLPYMGDSWSTQDLSAKYQTPQTKVSPTAVVHDGYTSVYTVDWNGDLQETFLPYMGDSWSTQDLTAKYNVPQDINVAPAALFHDGYTSVYYLTGPDDHLVEAYLPVMSGSWGSQDLSATGGTLPGTPPSVQSPSPLVHYGTDGGLTWASVYTIDAASGDVQETYLSDVGFPGDAWATQDLSGKYHTPPAAAAGSTLYGPSSSSEYLGYVRMTKLEYAGTADGDLLATFEHTTGSGGEGTYVIQRSTDGGATWSTLSTVPGGDVKTLAPFLYEFPQQLGTYPAGTLMLLGSTRNGSDLDTAIREWLSTDHGVTWTSVGVVQSGGGLGDGVYEPFVTVDSSGNLAMFFSDERQNATYSQFIGEIISYDGGQTWSANPDGSTRSGQVGELKVVASTIQADRPGMATVAQVGGGEYVLSYEDCGPASCDVYTKASLNGDTWGSGPSDMGTRAQTSNGLHLEVSPVITWVPSGGADGTLYLTANKEVTAGGPIPAGQTVILTNTDNGAGSWSWIPAPAIPAAGASSSCNTNYSPDLLEGANGTSLLYSTAAAAGPYNCEEVTDPVPIAS